MRLQPRVVEQSSSRRYPTKREIKFRCFNTHANVMQSWEDMVNLNKMHLLANQKPSYQIMQFTGLKDINGKDIYEGDIIKSTSFGLVYKVDWDTSAATFLLQLLGAPIMDYEGMDAFGDEIEVIGNIHENPELLKR